MGWQGDLMPDALGAVGEGLFVRNQIRAKGMPPMPSIEELIRVLLPILPDAEVTTDNGGQIVIYTGLMMPKETA
jgi:hypothetical protein